MITIGKRLDFLILTQNRYTNNFVNTFIYNYDSGNVIIGTRVYLIYY